MVKVFHRTLPLAHTWILHSRSSLGKVLYLPKQAIDLSAMFHCTGELIRHNFAPLCTPQHCQLSKASCKHQDGTIKHSIGPTTCSPHNGAATINSLYFTAVHQLKVSEREQAIVWARQAFTRAAGISSHVQSGLRCMGHADQQEGSVSQGTRNWNITS